MKFMNEAATFLFELLMVAAVFILFVQPVSPLALALTLAVVVAGAVMVVWGRFLAPRAKNRLGPTAGLLVSSLMTAFGPLVLLAAYPSWPVYLVLGAFLLNRAVAIRWKQW